MTTEIEEKLLKKNCLYLCCFNNNERSLLSSEATLFDKLFDVHMSEFRRIERDRYFARVFFFAADFKFNFFFLSIEATTNNYENRI